MSVGPVSAAETFCTIMSMLMLGASDGLEDLRGLADLVRDADDRDLGLAAVVGDAGDDRGFHDASFGVLLGLSVIQVPSFGENDERTWIGISKRRAYSTHRRCRILAPQAAISSISS